MKHCHYFREDFQTSNGEDEIGHGVGYVNRRQDEKEYDVENM